MNHTLAGKKLYPSKQDAQKMKKINLFVWILCEFIQETQE